MRLVVQAFLTLDGVVQAPGGPEEDPSGEFRQGGWLVPFADADMLATVVAWTGRADAFLLGRRTYEIFAAHWPRVTDPDDPIAAALNGLPKHVVSTTLERSDWSGTTIIRGDVTSRVGELKALPGRELQVHGSGQVARTLLDAGLVDELRLIVFPVLLGEGRRLLDRPLRATAFELVESRVTSTGAFAGAYRACGPPERGSFAVDERTSARDLPTARRDGRSLEHR